MTRPTLPAVGLFGLSVPLALLIVTGWRELWFLSLYLPGAALALILADWSMALPNGRLTAAPRLPRRLHVGRSGVAALRLEAENSTRPLAVTALLEQTGEAEEPVPVTGVMAAGRPLDLEFSIFPERRGRITVEAVWLRWRGPLGLVELRRRQPVGESIEVVPDIRGIHDEALRFFARDAAYGLKSQRLKGEGAEFDSLCEYAPGMDQRFIDWKSSARRRKLLCKEFRQERNHHIVLGYDVGRLMLEPVEGAPKLDHAVRAGLLLGWISLRNGDFVGGCGFDVRFRSFIEPGRGLPYFRQVQSFAASLAYRTEETNFTLGLAELNARLRRRSLVVLFTEFVDSISAELLLESLQLMARKHVIVFVTMRDPMLARLKDAPPDDFTRVAEAVIADGFLRERSIVLERAARLGVHCLDVSAQGLSAALLNRYLLIKQRGLL
ncbi:MAG: DUF58 domain-containing protein [Candidatus Adiutrix sp.]|jgi:uncharacterized protein (DUF58 family)|nr:DUF58 domain-containing protein [Candidatus Adiutrix sp.]